MRFAIVTALMLSTSSALASAQTAQQAPPPAPNTMSRQELRDEVTQQRAIIQGRAVRPQRPAGCVSPESRQFDFWVGEWDVSPSGSVRRQIIRDRWRRDLTEALAHLVVDPKQLSYDGASVVGGWFVV